MEKSSDMEHELQWKRQEQPIDSEQETGFLGEIVKGCDSYTRRGLNPGDPNYNWGCLTDSLTGQVYSTNFSDKIEIGTFVRADLIKWKDHSRGRARRRDGFSAVNEVSLGEKPIGNTNPNPPNDKLLYIKDQKSGHHFEVPEIMVTFVPEHLDAGFQSQKGKSLKILPAVVGVQSPHFYNMSRNQGDEQYFDVVRFKKPDGEFDYVAVNVFWS